jgi:hypothetical protein
LFFHLFIPQNHSIGERIVVRYFSGGTTEAWCCGRKRTNILNPNVSWCACRKRRKFILFLLFLFLLCHTFFFLATYFFILFVFYYYAYGLWTMCTRPLHFFCWAFFSFFPWNDKILNWAYYFFNKTKVNIGFTAS